MTGAEPCRETCTTTAPPPSSELDARQATGAWEPAGDYTDGTRRAWYACQMRRHSGAVTDDAPACWVR